MSSDERPATRAVKERWLNLLSFWQERRRGPYDRDFTEWRLEMGLVPRTARENYWNGGETLGYIRIVFENKVKYWEYCENSGLKAAIEPKRRYSAKAEAFFEQCRAEKRRIKDKMLSGPCSHQCVANYDYDCRNCSTFNSLTNKDFLEE